MERIPTREEKENVPHPEIAQEILKRTEADQEMRLKCLEPGFEWDENIDLNNTEAMKGIIARIGWPTVSKVGEKASTAAWLLVQHADHDPEFQKQCLELMKLEPDGEVLKRDVAYLEDRVRVNTGRPQVYGTQFHETRDEEDRQTVTAYGPQPIEDIERLDELRASVGLEPFEEYRKEITGRYYPQFLESKED